MKSRSITPTALERELRESEYIVSTTDRSGRITSANEVLVALSGYSRLELQGAQHNILRHPDMPRAVFWLAWDTLQSGEGFLGYIKNLGKDGSFYWVFAHMMPEHDEDGGLVGFRSVRRRPARRAIPAVAALYAEMLAAEQATDRCNAITAGLDVLRRHLGERRLSYEQMIAAL
jgi:PAS domain S-box-containing protein